MRRLFYTLAFIAIFAVIGKACQYIAVTYLGRRLGFEAASLIGLMPFVTALMFLKARYPRYFAFQAVGR